MKIDRFLSPGLTVTLAGANPGRLTISYNVNSGGAADVYRDVTIYRPRFITVDLNGVS